MFVPADLQRQLRRAEIIRSLRTTDASEALRRQSLWESHVGILFNHVRRRGRSMKPEELETLTQRYLATSFDEIEDRLALDGWSSGGLEIHSSQINERCHELSDALAEADVSLAIDLAAEMAPQADEQARRKLARRLIEVQLQAGVAEIKAIAGEPLRRPEVAQRAHVVAVPKPSPNVSEMAALYAEERIAQNRWSAKTAKQGETIFKLIADLLGDPAIGEVTKHDIRQLGLDITRLPANMTKRYRGLAVAEVLAATGSDVNVARLESRSVNKHYQHVRTLFAWAAEHDHIAQNPAHVLHDVEEGRAQDARKAFDDSDITAFFAEIEKKAKEPYGTWIPRIMAYTGCRMGEAAQLRKVDVRMELGVAVFDFNEDSEQKNLKTDGSKRKVPIHPRLIELGLMDFVSACDQEFLFPERVRFTANPARGNMDLLSKQLNRWLRSAGVIDRRKSVQSFRGTFATRLKDLGVAEYHIAEVVGHENDNITSGRYGKRTNLAALHNVVTKLQLPV
nr:site-specific integrase [Rhodanobacter sp. Root480]